METKDWIALALGLFGSAGTLHSVWLGTRRDRREQRKEEREDFERKPAIEMHIAKAKNVGDYLMTYEVWNRRSQPLTLVSIAIEPQWRFRFARSNAKGFGADRRFGVRPAVQAVDIGRTIAPGEIASMTILLTRLDYRDREPRTEAEILFLLRSRFSEARSDLIAIQREIDP